MLNTNETFAFETTLSTRSYKNKILEAKSVGYAVTLLFFWLQTVELANERVRNRVSEGGHNIEKEIIARRYNRGIKNLFEIYLPIVDNAYIFDNSEGKHELMANKLLGTELVTVNKKKFELLKMNYDSN